MKAVETSRLAANSAVYQQDQLDLHPIPDRVTSNPIRYQKLFAVACPRIEPVQFHDGQYSIQVQSVYEGINFRSVSLDPKSMGLAVPLDELTGLPLPIMGVDSPPEGSNTSFSDYHHHYHPERDLMNADDALLALRRSRGQYLPRWLHEHYHKFFAGPELPETREQTFAAVVLACAGVVPRKAIDFSSLDGPRIVEMDDNHQYSKVLNTVAHEGERKLRSGSFSRAQIGMFFANYAIEQSFENVIRPSLIDEFLSTQSMDRRKVLGNLMLSTAVGLSVEPVIPVHQALKKHNIARKRKTDLPQLIKDFFVSHRRPDYYAALDRKLSVA